jgi:hypothetical protein
MTIINLGDTVRIYGSAYNAGVLADPTTMTITVTPPLGAPVVYAYPADPEVVHPSTGQFYLDLVTSEVGIHAVAWVASGGFSTSEDDTFEVADPATISTVDDSTVPVAVPFVDYKLIDSDSVVIAEGQTDGTYQLSALKIGWRFTTLSQDIIGAGPHTFTITGTVRLTRYLTATDLETAAGPKLVDQLFNDDNSGLRDSALMERIMQQAENLADSRMLRGWAKNEITTLALADDGFRSMAAWVAMELITERRGEFISADGKGRYIAQYDRAMKYFDDLSKSKIHSVGEETAGANANTGGELRPTITDNSSRFTFANEPDGSTHGGF